MVKLKLNPPKKMDNGNEPPVQSPAALNHSSPITLIRAQPPFLHGLIDILKFQLPRLRYPIRIRVYRENSKDEILVVGSQGLLSPDELWEDHADLRYLSLGEKVFEEEPHQCGCDETDPPEQPIGLGSCRSEVEGILMFCQHEHVPALKHYRLAHHQREDGQPMKRFRVCYRCRNRAHNRAPPVYWPSDNENQNDSDNNHGDSPPSNDELEENEPDLNPHGDAPQANEQGTDSSAHRNTAMHDAHKEKVTTQRAYWRQHQNDWPQLLGHKHFNTGEQHHERTMDLQSSRTFRQVRETKIENLALTQRTEIPAPGTAGYARMMLNGLDHVFYVEYDRLYPWEKRWIFDWEEFYRTQAGLPRIPSNVKATLNDFALQPPNAHNHQNDRRTRFSNEKDTNFVRPTSSRTHAPKQIPSASLRFGTEQAQTELPNAAETTNGPEDMNEPSGLQSERSLAPAATRQPSAGQRMPIPGSEEEEDRNLQLAMIRDAEQRRQQASRFECELPYSKDSNEFVLDPRWREEGRRRLQNQGLQQNVPTSILEYRAMAPRRALALQSNLVRLARTRRHVHQDTDDLSESDSTAAGVLRLINEALTTDQVALQLFGQQLVLRQWVWHVRLFYATILHSHGWTVDVDYGSEDNYDDVFQDNGEELDEESELQGDSSDNDDDEAGNEPERHEEGSGDRQSGNDNEKSAGAQSLASGRGGKPPDKGSSSRLSDHRAKGSKGPPTNDGSSSGSPSQETNKKTHVKSSKNEKSSSPSHGQPKPSSAESQMENDETRYNTAHPHTHSTAADEDVSSTDRPRKRKSPQNAPDTSRKRSKGSPSSDSSSSSSKSPEKSQNGKPDKGSDIPKERGQPRISGNIDESVAKQRDSHRSRQEDIRSATEKIIQWVIRLREQHQDATQNADNDNRPPQQSHNRQQGVEAPGMQTGPIYDPTKAGPVHDSHLQNDQNALQTESHHRPNERQPEPSRGDRRAGNNNNNSPFWGGPKPPPSDQRAGNIQRSPSWAPVSPKCNPMAGAGGSPSHPDGGERRERAKLIKEAKHRIHKEHQEWRHRLRKHEEKAPQRLLVRETLREIHALQQRTGTYFRKFKPVSRGASWKHWINHAHTDVCGRCHYEQKRLHPEGFRGCTCYADRYQSQWLCNKCDEVACTELMYDAAHVNDNWQHQQIVDGRFDANAPSSAPLGRCLCGTVGTLRNHAGKIELSDQHPDPPDLPKIDTRYMVKRCGLCLNFVVPAGGPQFPDISPPSHNEPVRKPRKPRVKGEVRRTRYSRRQQDPACNTAYRTPVIDLVDVPINVNAEGHEIDQRLVMLDAQGRPIDVNENGFEIRLGPSEWQTRHAKARAERDDRANRRRRKERARDRERSRPYLMDLDMHEAGLDATHSRMEGTCWR